MRSMVTRMIITQSSSYQPPHKVFILDFEFAKFMSLYFKLPTSMLNQPSALNLTLCVCVCGNPRFMNWFNTSDS
jgi:hypothetical protein